MPRGRPKKQKDGEIRPISEQPKEPKPESPYVDGIDGNTDDEDKQTETTGQGVVVVEEKAKQKLDPLAPGQKYFEAPDGAILIGDANKDKLFYRKLGIYINPKR